MIKIENVEVTGWKAAIRGMRNPMNSWDKSDTIFDISNSKGLVIGENDLKLMKTLVKAGSDHRKFLRYIDVSMDITAPLYWWKEFDTYKVGTVANSCSTMHKIHAKPFSRGDFSCERMSERALTTLDSVILELEYSRVRFNETKDKRYWDDMIQLLPTSFNQMRTVKLNYEVLMNQYYARRNHKLDEWIEDCSYMICNLPYFEEICLGE